MRHNPDIICVVFVAYQEGFGDIKPIPIFNIYGNHRRHRSTVSIETLESEGLEIPRYPSYEEWKKNRDLISNSIDMLIDMRNREIWQEKSA